MTDDKLHKELSRVIDVGLIGVINEMASEAISCPTDAGRLYPPEFTNRVIGALAMASRLKMMLDRKEEGDETDDAG